MRFRQLRQFRQLSQIKHLRGKHDQQDHGRDGASQGSGVRGAFESLDEFGLKGWKRQRLDTPPDYSAYDEATPGRPEWMNDQRWERGIPSSVELGKGPPSAFRTITQTPEGDPVRNVWGNTIESSESDIDPRLVIPFSDDRYVPGIRKKLEKDIWRSGEEIFASQSSDANRFWRKKPKDVDQNMSYAVLDYGGALFKPVNALTRGTPFDKYTLASEFGKTSDDVVTIIRTIDSGMKPAPETIFARRGVGENTFRRMQQHLKVGDRFTDDSFTSASITPIFNWQSSPMVNIILTEGTPTLWTDSKALLEEENEVIIGRGVTYEVVSTDNERGWILRTVPSKKKYVPPEIPS